MGDGPAGLKREWKLWSREEEGRLFLESHSLVKARFPTRREALQRLQDALALEEER